jgi:hypothetical protein
MYDAADHFYHKPETGLAINICLGRDFRGANLIINDDSGARLSVPQVAGTPSATDYYHEHSISAVRRV